VREPVPGDGSAEHYVAEAIAEVAFGRAMKPRLRRKERRRTQQHDEGAGKNASALEAHSESVDSAPNAATRDE
jgi:hypothetical protein